MKYYVRVTEDNPCPVCGKPDWCLCHHTGRKAICTRKPSGIRKGNLGYLHYLGPDMAPAIPLSNLKPKVYKTPAEVVDYLHTVQCNPRDPLFAHMAHLLRLSTYALEKMGTGYDVEKAVLTFPMFNARGEAIGVRFRRRDGKKWSLTGGREGVFRARNFHAGVPVWITEGPTDAAALVDAGLTNVLGRPNCSGGVEIIQGLLTPCPRTPVVILADPDDPGVAGAERLVLSLPNPAIVLTGPSDIREFVSKFPDRKKAGESIVGVLSGCNSGPWKVIARNAAGARFNFSASAMIGNVGCNSTAFVSPRAVNS